MQPSVAGLRMVTRKPCSHMNQTTQHRLIKLNQRFYDKVAPQFDQKRQYPWEGWQKGVPQLKKLNQTHGAIDVLDLGCGNARFADFLNQNDINHQYLGLDANHYLVQQAKQKGANVHQVNLFKKPLTHHLTNKRFHLIVAFGLLHHLPSFTARHNVNQQAVSLLKQNGCYIISLWQFHRYKRFQEKMVNWDSNSNIDPSQLEEHDYLLNWQGNNQKVRYCHSFSDPEIARLKHLTPAKCIDHYQADGKNNYNHYLVFEKT